MKTLTDIYLSLAYFGDVDALNRHLIGLLKAGEMSPDLFAEYLAITQGEVADALIEAMPACRRPNQSEDETSN